MAKLLVETDISKILNNYGYKKVSSTHYKHPEGHEIKVDPNHKYPYSIKHKDYKNFDTEFSLDGLIDQLGDIHG